jgi:hypothetical protein
MDATQTEAKQRADISFMVVLNGAKYAPVLVQRERFIRKVGRESARKTYHTAYSPKDFPSPTFVGAGDA